MHCHRSENEGFGWPHYRKCGIIFSKSVLDIIKIVTLIYLVKHNDYASTNYFIFVPQAAAKSQEQIDLVLS